MSGNVCRHLESIWAPREVRGRGVLQLAASGPDLPQRRSAQHSGHCGLDSAEQFGVCVLLSESLCI